MENWNNLAGAEKSGAKFWNSNETGPGPPAPSINTKAVELTACGVRVRLRLRTSARQDKARQGWRCRPGRGRCRALRRRHRRRKHGEGRQAMVCMRRKEEALSSQRGCCMHPLVHGATEAEIQGTGAWCDWGWDPRYPSSLFLWLSFACEFASSKSPAAQLASFAYVHLRTNRLETSVRASLRNPLAPSCFLFPFLELNC
jgi:hypothetical protein